MGPQSLFTKCVAASVITLIDSFNVLKSPVIILIVCGRDNDNRSMAYIVIAVYHMAFFYQEILPHKNTNKQYGFNCLVYTVVPLIKSIHYMYKMYAVPLYLTGLNYMISLSTRLPDTRVELIDNRREAWFNPCHKLLIISPRRIKNTKTQLFYNERPDTLQINQNHATSWQSQ